MERSILENLAPFLISLPCFLTALMSTVSSQHSPSLFLSPGILFYEPCLGR